MQNSLLYWKLNIIFSTRRTNHCSEERALDADGSVTRTLVSSHSYGKYVNNQSPEEGRNWKKKNFLYVGR